MARKIFDCFTFFNEKKMLQLRIALLSHTVDFFVIVEATRTFTGMEKNRNFNPHDYAVHPERLIYVSVTDMPGPTVDAWTNERHQRNAILRGLKTAKDNDLIVISDVDEIPNPTCFSQYRDWWVSASLEQQLFYYRWNNLVHEADGQPVRWTGAKITLLRHLRDYWQTPENLRKKTLASRTLLNRLKYRLCSSTLRDAGWHWSYLMTPAEASEKIRSFSHTEFCTSEFSDAEKIKERMDSMVDPFGRTYQIKAVSPKSAFPESVIESLRQHFGEVEHNELV